MEEQLQKNVDDLEAEIELKLENLKVMNSFVDTVSKIQEQYANIRDNYYQKRLSTFTEEGTLKSEMMVSTTARYVVDLENDIIPQVRDIYSLAVCKQLGLAMESGEVKIDEIREILDRYSALSPTKYQDARKELREYLLGFFYKIIKKDAEENDRYAIIDILYEYKNYNVDFITGVNLLFLKEVNELFQKEKDKTRVVKLVKIATTDAFNKDDIVALLETLGKKEVKKEDKKNTIEFVESIQTRKKISYTTKKNVFGDVLFDLGKFLRTTKVNPLPKTEEENKKLREYDLTLLDYGTTSGNLLKKEKYFYPSLNGVNLSHTNAVIDPRYLKIGSLHGANLEGVDLRGVNLTDVDIEGANLLGTGADIRRCKGTCLGVSAYEDHRILVSDKKITPMRFKELTGYSPFAPLCKRSDDDDVFDNVGPWHNRVLRQFDLSCVDCSYEYIRDAYYKQKEGYLAIGKYSGWTCEGLDLSYTNIDFDPQVFKGADDDKIVLNLEGVDLRDKDFTGVETIFGKCNLKGTGANLDPKYNHTVSEYVVPSRTRSK